MEELEETVKNLNRINLVYKYAIRNGRPYRVAFIRKMYQRILEESTTLYSLHEFDGKNYLEIFEPNPRLEIVMMKKKDAISGAKYEIAASFRDMEIAILRSLLLSIGVAKSDRFFVSNGKIYRFL